MTLIVGDLFVDPQDDEETRWLVTNVTRNAATARSAGAPMPPGLSVSGLMFHADSNVTVLCNPQRDWIFVPIKRTGPVNFLTVNKPFLFRGGCGTQPLAYFHDWVDAGAGIYVNPLVGLLRGDILNVTLTNQRVIQARIKSLDTLAQKAIRAKAPPQAPVTAFDRLLRDDDD